MLTPTTKKIGGYSVTYIPLQATIAASLDLKVSSLIMPIVKSLDFSNLKAEVNIPELLGAVSQAIAMLDERRVVDLLLTSLRGCTIQAPGRAPVEVTSEEVLDDLFAGELETLYKAVFESWKFNKLSPFALATRFGVKIGETSTSDAVEEPHAGPGLKLAK